MGRRQNQTGDPDSDDAAIGLSATDRSLLGTIVGTDRTRRIAVDDDGNLLTSGSSSSATPLLAHEFARIKNKQFKDTEEVRYDIPLVLVSANTYVGVATSGTATSSATWTVIRTDFDANKNPSRDRIRFNLSWDNRTVGW